MTETSPGPEDIPQDPDAREDEPTSYEGGDDDQDG